MSNTLPFDRLTQPQRIALISILSGDSAGRTAALAQVTERTLRRWRRQADFQAAFAEARLDFFSACRSHVNASLAAAFQTLVGVADYSGKPGEQLKAATFLLGRVAGAGMSAKPARREPKPQKMNHFHAKGRGHQRTSAARRGPQRTPVAFQRTSPVSGGLAPDVSAPTIPSS